jgi:hypothetical protein
MNAPTHIQARAAFQSATWWLSPLRVRDVLRHISAFLVFNGGWLTVAHADSANHAATLTLWEFSALKRVSYVCRKVGVGVKS